MNPRTPNEFMKHATKYIQSKGVCNLELKEDKDAFGNPLETELSRIYTDKEIINKKTNSLKDDFPSSKDYGISSETPPYPGAINDIVDFENILCFGTSGDGSPFCFDFRQDPPSVIWWDDDHWRKLANNFKDFIELFKHSQ
ncbi:SMI1/KNR4 family protein [Pseudomonas sp. NPDC089407]|uniref:SMI1/KNR4 family protein n=1 Tax=Pseudomonas sp. NPDC089407 TaxID=3364464 RepID=UPI00384B1F5E